MRTSFWPALVTDLQDYWTPSKWLLCLGFVCTARENNKRNEKRRFHMANNNSLGVE
jgi:hypothetical protein